MKKKICLTALLAALILSLTACGGGEGDPLAAAMKNMSDAASMDASMVMEMDMEAGGETLESVTTMDMTMFTDPMRMKINMSLDLGGYGMVDMEAYAEEGEDDAVAMYLYDSDSQEWMSQTLTMDDMAEYNLGSSLESYVGSTSGFTQAGKETVDGVDAYKYTGVITGEKMQEVMEQTGALDSLGSMGLEDEAQLEEMLSGMGDIQVTLWISEEGNYPIRYEMDMTAVMDGLVQAAADGMGGGDMAMSIPKMTVTMTCSNFNSATEFTIPEEARG